MSFWMPSLFNHSCSHHQNASVAQSIFHLAAAAANPPITISVRVVGRVSFISFPRSLPIWNLLCCKNCIPSCWRWDWAWMLISTRWSAFSGPLYKRQAAADFRHLGSSSRRNCRDNGNQYGPMVNAWEMVLWTNGCCKVQKAGRDEEKEQWGARRQRRGKKGRWMWLIEQRGEKVEMRTGLGLKIVNRGGHLRGAHLKNVF